MANKSNGRIVCSTSKLDSTGDIADMCREIARAQGLDIGFATGKAALVSWNLERTRLLVVDSNNLWLAQDAREAGYKGGIVVVEDDGSGIDKRYWNEAWEKLEFNGLKDYNLLEAVVRKYTADKPRVLVVEDDKNVKPFFTKLLKGLGYIPIEAENAENALQHVPSVHAVLSDIEQPGSIGGYGLLEKIRSVYDGSQLPVVLMSGRSIDAVKARGAQALLEKPFPGADLEICMDSFVPEHLKPARTQ